MDYIAYLHKENSSDYGVSFPDFPGCATAGKTLQEAYKMAAEALALHIQGMIEDGETIPEPSTLDQLAGDPDLGDGMVALVHAEAPGKTVRFNVTAREGQLEAIDRLAKASGMNRSAFLVQAALHANPTASAPPVAKRPRPRHRMTA